MKKISLLIILAILFSSCSHLSMDFAKRKYRPGYYVNLSSNKANSHQPIAISRTKELDKRIADLSPINTNRNSDLSDNHPSTIIIPTQSGQFLSSTPIKNKLQNGAVYNRSEDRLAENISYIEIKSDPKQGDFNGVAIVSFGFSVLTIILVGIALLLGNASSAMGLLITIAVLSALISCILGIAAFGMFSTQPDLRGRGYAAVGILLFFGSVLAGLFILVHLASG